MKNNRLISLVVILKELHMRSRFGAIVCWLVVLIFTSLATASSQTLEGSWSGTATDSRASERPFPVSMTLDSTGNGRIDYRSFPCGGTLTLLSHTGNTYRYLETLTYGVKLCINGGELTVVPSGDSLQWTWRGGGASATASLAGHRVETSPAGCITAARTLRTQDGFVYWNFANSCSTDHMVNVCAEYANGNNNRLSTNVPARQSADINLGGTSTPTADLSFEVDKPVRCPRK
jgi:hypothetical protein